MKLRTRARDSCWSERLSRIHQELIKEYAAMYKLVKK